MIAVPEPLFRRCDKQEVFSFARRKCFPKYTERTKSLSSLSYWGILVCDRNVFFFSQCWHTSVVISSSSSHSFLHGYNLLYECDMLGFQCDWYENYCLLGFGFILTFCNTYFTWRLSHASSYFTKMAKYTNNWMFSRQSQEGSFLNISIKNKKCNFVLKIFMFQLIHTSFLFPVHKAGCNWNVHIVPQQL
jgi:hypothetical protein